jgi:dTDP-4-dehydrorhamnose 3,5-epimerase-like enzyme
MKIKNIETYNDERADRFFDIFPGLEGQITISAIKPLQFSGWHKHELQTDWFSVVKGRVKVAVISPSGEVFEYVLDAREPRTLEIPPHHLHSWLSFDCETVLVYYLSRKHDEEDEFRMTEEEIFEKFSYKI